MSIFDEIYKRDVAFALSEMGDTVTYNGIDGYGNLQNEPVEVINLGNGHDAVQSVTTTLTIVAGSLGRLVNHTQITVAGVDYQIEKFIPNQNGLETKLWLTKAN